MRFGQIQIPVGLLVLIIYIPLTQPIILTASDALNIHIIIT